MSVSDRVKLPGIPKRPLTVLSAVKERDGKGKL